MICNAALFAAVGKSHNELSAFFVDICLYVVSPS